MIDAAFLAVLVIAGAGLARVTLLESLTAAVVAGVEGIAAGMAVWLLRWFFFSLRKYQGLAAGV
jgi:hypothetical protein